MKKNKRSDRVNAFIAGVRKSYNIIVIDFMDKDKLPKEFDNIDSRHLPLIVNIQIDNLEIDHIYDREGYSSTGAYENDVIDFRLKVNRELVCHWRDDGVPLYFKSMLMYDNNLVLLVKPDEEDVAASYYAELRDSQLSNKNISGEVIYAIKDKLCIALDYTSDMITFMDRISDEK